MFSGIIQDVGQISSLVKLDNFIRITITSKIKSYKIGSSICCSGICLTVTSIPKKNTFTVDVSPETLEKTNANNWSKGMPINIENSLKLGDEISGHFVFGHVDGVCTITEIAELDGCQRWLLKAPKELIKYIAKKGSVSLSGVSLTVNSVSDYVFSINLIPFTLSHTTLKYNKAGDKLNIEIDMLARYVESINKK